MRVDEHTIAVGTMTPVFYRAAASADVPILYLHGVPTSADDWTPALERFGGVAPDLPGFGRSTKAGHLDYSLDGYAAFIERLLDQLRLDAVRLVAHDWGAAFGLRFAVEHAERIGGPIVLFNPLPLVEDFSWHRLARAWRRPVVGEILMGFTGKRVLARALRRGAAYPEVWPPARIDQEWEHFDQGTQRATLRLHRSVDDGDFAEAGAGLDRVDAPTLIVWGERDPWLPAQLADGFAARFRRASVERIADAGHWPWLERPAVLDRVATFLGERS